MPIYDAFKKCDEDFKNFKNSDIGKLHKINDDEDIDVGFALKNVSKYQYYVDSYSQQINLCVEINKLLSKRNLMSLLELLKKKDDKYFNKVSLKEKDIFLNYKNEIFKKNYFQKVI